MKLLLALIALAVLFPFSPAFAADLDGTTCIGEAGEKGKTAAEKDELIFTDGTFRSKGCDPYGFKSSAYTTKKEGDAIHFESTGKSEKEGEIRWTGWIKGDACEAQYVWTKPGQKDIEYWYKGAIKK